MLTEPEFLSTIYNFYKFCYCYHKFSQNRIVEQQNQNPLFIMGHLRLGQMSQKALKLVSQKNDCKKISMHSFLKGYLFSMLFIFKPHLFYKHKIIFHSNALNSEIMSAVQRVSLLQILSLSQYTQKEVVHRYICYARLTPASLASKEVKFARLVTPRLHL